MTTLVTSKSRHDSSTKAQKGPRRRSSALRFLNLESSEEKKQAKAQAAHAQWETSYIDGLRTFKPPTVENASSLAQSQSKQRRSLGRHSAMDVMQTFEQRSRVISHSSIKGLGQGSSRQSSSEHSSGCGNVAKLPRIDSCALEVDIDKDDAHEAETDHAVFGLKSLPIEYREGEMRRNEKKEAQSLRRALQLLDFKDEQSQICHDAAQESRAIAEEQGDTINIEPLRAGRVRFEEKPSQPNVGRETDNSVDNYHDISSDDQGLFPEPLRFSKTRASSSSHTGKESSTVSTSKSNTFRLPSLKANRRTSSGRRSLINTPGPFKNPDDQIYVEPSSKGIPPVPKLSANPDPNPQRRRLEKRDSKLTGQRPLPQKKMLSDRSKGRRTSNARPMNNVLDGKDVFEHGTKRKDTEGTNKKRDGSATPHSTNPTIKSRPTGLRGDCDREGHVQSNTSLPFDTPECTSSSETRDKDQIPEVDIPTISVDTSAAPIEVSRPEIPLINVPDQDDVEASPDSSEKPIISHSCQSYEQESLASQQVWHPGNQRGTAQCAACALPIAGQIVTAASNRFHPTCFRCHHCNEQLECIAFYTEPEKIYSARIARIRARNVDDTTNDLNIDTMALLNDDDGDENIRFYCHLDYHELFSPRCRNCKTPIEGEVISACDGYWHVGHFFCAECGDPFESTTPFVERDGYAWCLSCHAGRFNGKCKGCRKTVTDQGIEALGAEWHEKCFVCSTCGHDFPDGRFFTREEDERPVCVECEEIRLKA